MTFQFFSKLVFSEQVAMVNLGTIFLALGIPLSHAITTITPEIVRIKQGVENETGTECSFVSWISKESFYNILDKIDKFQTFVHVNDLAINVTRSFSARWKFARHCSLVLYYHPNLKILDKIVHKVWKSFVPGYPLFSYYVVYISEKRPQTILGQLPEHFTTSTHLLILFDSQRNQNISNTHYDLHPSGQLRAWSGPGMFHDRANFNGQPLIFAAFADFQTKLAPDKIAAYMKK